MDGLTTISIISAFAGGIVSFLSPCVLPLVPGYVAYIAGGTLEDLTKNANSSRKRLAALSLSASFVIGFTLVFVGLGASASAVGDFLLKYKTEFEYTSGAIIIVFGLYMTGFLKISFLSKEFRFISRIRGGHPLSAILLGMAFAFGWTPCIGPILGSILTLSATSGTVASGSILLAMYSLGLGIPFLIAAGFTGFFMQRLQILKKLSKPFQFFAGCIMVIMGIAMVTGYLATLGFFLIEIFPGLSSIG